MRVRRVIYRAGALIVPKLSLIAILYTPAVFAENDLNRYCSGSLENWHLTSTGVALLKDRWPTVVSWGEARNGTKYSIPKIGISDDAIPSDLTGTLQGTVQSVKGCSNCVEPGSALADHGLRVANSIAGKRAGVLNAADLRFASIAVESLNNKLVLDGRAGYQASLQSCAEGYKTINFSFGHPFDAFERVDEFKSSVFSDLLHRGCLVTIAAGNGNDYLRGPDHPLRNQKSAVFVGSTSPAGMYSGFSSRGNLNFPGERLNLPSKNVVSPYRCSNTSVLNDGTSFAAPSVAGVLGEMRSLAELSPRFRALSPERQGQMLRTILLEAASPGTLELNVPRAILATLTTSGEQLDAIKSKLCPALTRADFFENSKDKLSRLSFKVLGCDSDQQDWNELLKVTISLETPELLARLVLNSSTPGSIDFTAISDQLISAASKGGVPQEKRVGLLAGAAKISQMNRRPYLATKAILEAKNRMQGTAFESMGSEDEIKADLFLVNLGLIDRVVLQNLLSDKTYNATRLISAFVLADRLNSDHLDFVLEYTRRNEDVYGDALRLGFGVATVDVYGFISRMIRVRPASFSLQNLREKLDLIVKQNRLTQDQAKKLLDDAERG